MNRFPSATFYLIITAMIILSCGDSRSSPVQQIIGGKLIGANDVIVDSNSYNVSFIDGTCQLLFNGCDNYTDFVFQTPERALMAGQALLSTVFVNSVFGRFDSTPQLTAGCGYTGLCYTVIPFEALTGPWPGGPVVVAENSATIGNTLPYLSTELHSTDYSNYSTHVWAAWTPRTDCKVCVARIGPDSLTGEIDDRFPTIVLVHGWQPDEQITDPFPLSAVYNAARERLLAEPGLEGVNIVTFTWPEAFTPFSLDGYRSAAGWTTAAAGDLVSQLIELLGKDYSEGGSANQNIHFIGHSLGSVVAANAIRLLSGKAGWDVDQLTILDGPMRNLFGALTGSVPVFDPSYFYRQLPPGSVDYVENYYSTDLLQKPPGFGSPIPGAAPGFGGNDVGGSHTAVHAVSYSGIVSTPSWITPVLSSYALRPEPATWMPPFVFLAEAIDPGSWAPRFGSAEVVGEELHLKEASPSRIGTSITIPIGASFFEFEFGFANVGDGDILKLFFDDLLLWEFVGNILSPGEFLPVSIPIAFLAGLTGELDFLLFSVGSANAEVIIRNMSFVFATQLAAVPEPATIGLVIFGLGSLALVLCRHRRPGGAVPRC